MEPILRLKPRQGAQHGALRQLVRVGQIVMTRGVQAWADEGLRYPYLAECLDRHKAGDWGAVLPDDWESNDLAVLEGERIFSAYALDPDKPCKGWSTNTLWIITDADRSTTTLMLPHEY